MKKINAMLITGSLLMAGALTSPAFAWGNDNDHNRYYNNRGSWGRFVNKTSNRYLGQPIYYGNDRYKYITPNYGGYYNNGYIGGYYGDYNVRPGLLTRIWNTIF